jgi:hypothetical protein
MTKKKELPGFQHTVQTKQRQSFPEEQRKGEEKAKLVIVIDCNHFIGESRPQGPATAYVLDGRKENPEKMYVLNIGGNNRIDDIVVLSGLWCWLLLRRMF